MPHTLIFDLGTTFFKAVLFDADGQTVAIARRPTPLHHPQPGHVEMDPVVFSRTLAELFGEFRREHAEMYADIADISFATQANSFLLLDNDDQPVTPIVVWTDQRAMGLDWPCIDDYASTGIPKMSGSFSPAKMCWLRQHQPQAWSRAKKLCYLSDYFTLWMTGQHVTAAGMAGLSGMLDIQRIAWRDDTLEALGFKSLKMPRPVRAGSQTDAVLADVARELGLARGCRFTVGCLDQFAAAYASDLIETGGTCETTGTVLATVSAARDFDPDLQRHGIFQGPTSTPNATFRMLFGMTSAGLVASYRQKNTPDLSFEELDALTTATGLDAEREKIGREVKAIYEQVAEALREQLLTLGQGHTPDPIVSLGGGARSATWREIKSEVTGHTFTTLPTDEPTAFGVFRLIHG